MSGLNIQDILALINDILQSAIVIFGTSIVLYNLSHSVNERVTRAFTALLAFVVIVLMTELLITHTVSEQYVESWLRIEWVGIAQVPAAMFHLADGLLVTTGDYSRRRRILVRAAYLLGIGFLLLAAFTDLIVSDVVIIPRAPHLQAGPLFPAFTAYFWIMTGISIFSLSRARQRSLTKITERRMFIILLALIAAPLSVYPYLLLSSSASLSYPIVFWLVLILGNIAVGVMFTLLTLQLVYFGATSPDRVVRVRLYKYLARVPLAATFVLIALQLVNRTTSFLGLPVETAVAFAVVATVIIVEWAVHTFKRPLQKILRLDQNPDVRRILSLSERIVTTSELRDFLESLLTAVCDSLRTPSAFIVSFQADGPQLEMIVGELADTDQILQDDSIRQLASGMNGGNGNDEDSQIDEGALKTAGEFILWEEYWLKPLYDHRNKVLLGLLGLRGRNAEPDFTPEEQVIFERLSKQAAAALEDHILQQEVFAAVENLLPQLNALQKRRSAAATGGAAVLTQEEMDTPINDPEFSSMVKDALSHYWGGPKLTESPLLQLRIVQEALAENDGNPTNALRNILKRAIEMQRPEGERSMTRAEWLLYNILELKFVQGRKVRDVARRLAMSESDLYRKQRVALENVARSILDMERGTQPELNEQSTAEERSTAD